ncbi:hypothetical protein CISIN_1g021423mg [Citrus sinensis]|uniref:RING-CH-type domain-containing protein n=1 Tax=Citrus sinensis TaxID=2711 RepID=A0A067GY17_CITSI|nr:hypothetical protein CISIN_1g021423mg [Citrus sinensis]
MKGDLQLEQFSERNPSDADPLLGSQEVSDAPVVSSPSSSSSSEIKDEDIENGSLPCCRICLENDGEPDDELISPCMCKGTQQFVHRACLDHWRSVKEGFAFSHCTTCKAQFHLRVELFEDNSWRKIKFRLFVARDVFFVFLAVQTIIAAMGGFAYLMDKDGAFRNSFSDGWDRILSKHPIPFYYCIELLLWVGSLGLFPCIYGSMLCPGYRFCCHFCHSWYSLWFPCCYHGYSKDLAETLPYSYQEGAHKGKIGFLLSSRNLCYAFYIDIGFVNLLALDL